MKLTDAQAIINAIVSLRESVDDRTASMNSILYPTLKKTEKLIESGTRINWNGELYRAAVDLWDREENNPDNAPSLWEEIQYKNGIRIIPEIITVGLAFFKGELGLWKGEVYISELESNTYTPDQYPLGWTKIEQ